MLFCDFKIGEMVLHALYILIVFMPFTGNQNDVVRGGAFDCVTDSCGAVGFDVFGRGYGRQNIADDVLRISKRGLSLVTTTLSAP